MTTEFFSTSGSSRTFHPFSVEWKSEAGSTLDLAAERLRSGRRTPFWVAVDRQTAGRGQYGRSWWSDRGSLLCAVAIRLQDYGIHDVPVGSGRFALMTGLAVVETVRPFLEAHGCDPVGLHWPNDVFCGSRKLAGILIESPSPGGLIAGIGVNVNNTCREAAPEIRDRIISLRDAGVPGISLVKLLESLAGHLEMFLWRMAEDPRALMAQIRSFCTQVHRQIRVERPGGDERNPDVLCTGWCRGIRDDGALIVETAPGEYRFFTSATVRVVE
ncbi:MAG: biotin--[acetyl-CoA-carboxylase] ligase [Planctomycetia bacterium]|nr:biotin--[acetyl-CoA-carboxylase] ligase [Planctomycetia bacterium]